MWPEKVHGVEPHPVREEASDVVRRAALLWDRSGGHPPEEGDVRAVAERRAAFLLVARNSGLLLRWVATEVHAGLRSFNNLLLPPLFTMLYLEMRGGGLPAAFSAKIEWLDALFSSCFLAEWALGLWLAQRRRRYVLNLWLLIDLVSVAPVLLAQAFRSLRALRILRMMKLGSLFRFRRVRLPIGRFLKALGIAASATLAGAIALRGVEPGTVAALEDGLWWSLVTVSTVGYGDISPVTPTGRLIATVLIVLGLGCFSYFTGLVAATVEDPEEEMMIKDLHEMKAQLARVELALERLTRDRDRDMEDRNAEQET